MSIKKALSPSLKEKGNRPLGAIQVKKGLLPSSFNRSLKGLKAPFKII